MSASTNLSGAPGYVGGVDFESKPHAMSSGTRLFFVKDPDGYRIEFIERK